MESDSPHGKSSRDPLARGRQITKLLETGFLVSSLPLLGMVSRDMQHCIAAIGIPFVIKEVADTLNRKYAFEFDTKTHPWISWGVVCAIWESLQIVANTEFLPVLEGLKRVIRSTPQPEQIAYDIAGILIGFGINLVLSGIADAFDSKKTDTTERS